MAAFTSKAAGNWSAGGQTTWNEVGVPGNGDTVSGTHAVTVDVNTTIGHSPGAGDATAAILWTAGSLTIAAGITLICRGDCKIGNVLMTMAAGAIFEFDASQAGTPSTALYVLQISTAASQTTAKLVCNGTTGSHCVIRSNTGGGNGRITDGAFAGGGDMDADFTDLLRVGDASNNAIKQYPTGSGAILRLEDCTLATCGRIAFTTNVAADATFELRRCVWSGTLNANPLVTAGLTAKTTGSRVIDGCVFDKLVDFSGGALGHVITNTVFLNAWSGVANTNVAELIQYNIIRLSSGGDRHGGGDVKDCYLFGDQVVSNLHGLLFNADRDYTVDGIVIEGSDPDGAGDALMVSTAQTRVRTFKNCLMVPGPDGEPWGAIVSPTQGAGITLRVEHLTFVVGAATEGGIRGGETYGGHVGFYDYCRNNLAWSKNGAGYIFNLGTSLVDGSIDECNYNGRQSNLTAAYEPADAKFTNPSPPGTNDVSVADPLFVDNTRNLPTFATAASGLNKSADNWADATVYAVGDRRIAQTSTYYGNVPIMYRCLVAHTSDAASATLGKPGGTTATSWRSTWEFASLWYIREAAAQLAGYDVNATPQKCIEWVRGGFVPQATALQAASDNVAPSNGWMGAVAGISSAGFTRLERGSRGLLRGVAKGGY